MRTGTALLLCLLSAVAARADLYTWTDKKGVEHFSSTPPDRADKVKAKTFKTRAPSPAAPAAPSGGDKPAAAKAGPKIELYVTSWCPVCKAARAYLNSRGFAYQEFDIEADPSAHARYAGRGGTGSIPLAVINDSVVDGFSVPAYARLLPP